MNLTTAPASNTPRGLMYQPLIGWPPQPAKVTSNTSTSGSPTSTGSNLASRALSRASANVLDQNSSKSAGGTTPLRYVGRSAALKSKNGMSLPNEDSRTLSV